MQARPSGSACVHLGRLPCEAGRGRRCGSSSTCSWLADNGASGPRTTDVICGTGARLVGGGGVGPRPMCCPGARGARLVVANHDVAGPARPRPDQPGAAQPSPGEARPAQASPGSPEVEPGGKTSPFVEYLLKNGLRLAALPTRRCLGAGRGGAFPLYKHSLCISFI